MWRVILTILVLTTAAGAPAFGAGVTLDVRDKDGQPVAGAVVALRPLNAAAVASHLPEKAVIDQRNETFIPFVVVIRKGGQVEFTNNDATMHQVYSFSPIGPFQFVIKQGEVSPPVSFDKPGVAAIGCNIHDQMIAYVYVGDAPFAAATDADGRAAIVDVPAGAYEAELWQAQSRLDAPRPVVKLSVGDTGATATMTLPYAVAPMRGMKHMHMDY